MLGTLYRGIDPPHLTLSIDFRKDAEGLIVRVARGSLYSINNISIKSSNFYTTAKVSH